MLRPEVVAGSRSGWRHRSACRSAVVVKPRETRRQLELANSRQQFSNVWDAFAVDDVAAAEPVLVDDLVDSRWTLMVGRGLGG